ncbi:OLC1v1028803C1 [Oldenlandia corymbosa var. corymbosa]|uniref:OLC1v1028803C1 n=1 Tax=Oldenlandia corymbosa var. corymbosa TaxID=529605 RepID=A0AAV1CFB3_OLDCO|nr:OLC1v1028803C1 [Oldenlandia corymbosa var. corymbosa]
MDGRFIRLWPWNTFTIGAVLLILTYRFFRWCSACLRRSSAVKPVPHAIPSSFSDVPAPQARISAIISDTDLKNLVDEVNDKIHRAEDWEHVIDRRNHMFSYTAKRTKPKDGPVKYLSLTVFENCSPELLRNFYMDNDYRKTWDNTIIEHKQLQVDVSSGTEFGRTIKKFPFLSPREYVLAWRVWEDKHGAFYCLSKGCEHPRAPSQRKYVRVMFHRSVAGRNACEITMVHQEDAGLNVEMAKLAFAKGIWSYVCKMNDALRLHSLKHTPALNEAMLIQKFPPGLEDIDHRSTTHSEVAADTVCYRQASESHGSRSVKAPPNKLLKNGLILVGSAICLSRGHSSLGAKVAMVYILTKLTKRRATSKAGKP